MFAVLGDIIFQVAGSPESLRVSHKYDYAELPVLEDRPRLQWLATGLRTISLELLLHRSLGSPAASLLALETVAESHLAVPLVFGNGDYQGMFVIVEIETIYRQLSAGGEAIAIKARARLKESPLELNPPTLGSGATPLLGIVSPLGASASASTANAPASALLSQTSASLRTTPVLLPDDVLAASIVRSA